MELKTQIYLLIFSFFYGIIFSLLMSLNHRFLYNEKKYLKILSTFIFILIAVLAYFIVLFKINYGILHVYSLIIVVLGFILENIVEIKLVAKYKKKWYNSC